MTGPSLTRLVLAAEGLRKVTDKSHAQYQPDIDDLIKMLDLHVDGVRHYLHLQIGKPLSKDLISAPEIALDNLHREMKGALRAQCGVQNASGLNKSLLDSAMEELDEGHLALDRLGSPRETVGDAGDDLICELFIAQRISAIPSVAQQPGLREALVKIRDEYGPNHGSKYCRDLAASALSSAERKL